MHADKPRDAHEADRQDRNPEFKNPPEGIDTPVAYPPGLIELLTGHVRDVDEPNGAHRHFLDLWGLRLIEDLPIRTKDGELLGMPPIKIKRLRNIKQVGSYDPDPDDWKIAGTIAFNEERLPELDDYLKLVFLAKFLVCAWRYRVWASEPDARKQMRDFGLRLTEDGKITVDGQGKFRSILRKHAPDMPVPEVSVLPAPRRRPRSTMVPWTCRCRRFRAQLSTGLERIPWYCSVCHSRIRRDDDPEATAKADGDGATGEQPGGSITEPGAMTGGSMLVVPSSEERER